MFSTTVKVCAASSLTELLGAFPRRMYAKGTIAIAYGTMNNSKTHILIDIGYWSKLSTLEKFTRVADKRKKRFSKISKDLVSTLHFHTYIVLQSHRETSQKLNILTDIHKIS